MIHYEGDREILEREEADNDPQLVRDRIEREARIHERRY